MKVTTAIILSTIVDSINPYNRLLSYFYILVKTLSHTGILYSVTLESSNNSSWKGYKFWRNLSG
jgi:hypothetical protein